MGATGAEGVASRLRELPGASVTSSQPLDALLDRLVAEDLVRTGPVLAWIAHVAREWRAGEFARATAAVRTFALRLAAEAVRDEGAFEYLLAHSEEGVLALVAERDSAASPSLRLGALDALSRMSEHASGARLVAERRLWETADGGGETIYFARTRARFLKRLAWKLDELGLDAECARVVESLAGPLLDARWTSRANTVIDDDERSRMSDALAPCVGALTAVLDDVERSGATSAVARAVVALDLDRRLWSIFQLCRRSRLLGDVARLLLLVRFARAFAEKRAGDAWRQWDVKALCMAHVNLVTALIAKRDADGALALVHFCHAHVVAMQRRHGMSMLIEKDNGLSYEFADQMLVLGLLPILCTRRPSRSEFVDLYVDKIVSLACEHTTRMAYAFRDLVREANDLAAPIAAARLATSTRKYLVRSQAIVAFQSFYYRLQDFVPDVEDVDNFVVENVDTREAQKLVSALLDAVHIFIEEFDIPWQDTVEVLCVYSFCIRIIKTPNVDSKLVIQAFKLAQLTIKKFLSPNLALLVNSSHGSVIEEIGKNIYEKLHDPCWDIRDSAMELLYVVTDIAEIKFPAFQMQIAENNLPELVITLAIEDSESYVRASALRCIGAMVRIQILWEKHLQYSDLTGKMIKILSQESEGLVRKEAACVMVNIYEYQKFTASSLDGVFVTMFRAAAEDLHWEVQLAALEFWKKIIANQMTHQGMIDGEFPAVTFSKENRKIVHLNDFEIKRRVIKILNELALRGCLGVLLTCIRDDSDNEVMEEALKIIDEVLRLLDKYNVTDFNTPKDSSVARPVFDENFLKDDSDLSKLSSYRNKADIRSEKNNITLNGGQNSDSVIESIVNSDDVNLLASVYANQLKVDGNEASDDVKLNIDKRNVTNMFVEPELFIKTVRETNFRNVLDQKRKWLLNMSTDIHSLLDDILGTYDRTSEVNTMDCY